MTCYLCIDDQPPRTVELHDASFLKPGQLLRLDSGPDEGILEVLDVVSNPSGTQIQTTRVG